MDAVTLPYVVFRYAIAARELAADTKSNIVLLNYRFQQLLGLGNYFGFGHDAFGELLKSIPHILSVAEIFVHDPRKPSEDVQNVWDEVKPSIDIAVSTDLYTNVKAAVLAYETYHTALKALHPTTEAAYPDFKASYAAQRHLLLCVAVGLLMSLQESLGRCDFDVQLLKEVELIAKCRTMYIEFQALMEAEMNALL